jgi:Domain of unknown function (DUF5011)
MKTFKISITGCLVLTCLLFSCNKEDFNYPEGHVGSSRITYFPELTLNGSPGISVVVGNTFTDPGAKATANGADIPVTVSGTVNTSQDGIYFITYTATNSDGFSASTQRVVAVIATPEVPGTDISGDYAPIGGAPSDANVTKLDQGLYFTTNCWGGGSLAVIPAYFICLDGATVSIPLQLTPDGHLETQSPGTYVNGLITWTVTRLDFPGGALTKTKQWQKQ